MAPPTSTVAPAKSTGGQSFADQPLAVKLVLLFMIVTALCAAYYFALHQGLAEDIQTAEQNHARLVTDRAEAVRRQQEFVRVSQQLVEREPIDRRNRRILPEEAEMASFLGDVNRLAELSGLSINLVQPQPETQREKYVALPVLLRLSGQFHQFAKFFHAVSILDRAVSLENLKVELAPAANRARRQEREAVPEVRLRVEVRSTAYRRPAAAAAPAAGAARTRARRAGGAR